MLKLEAITKEIRIINLSECLRCYTCEKSCTGRHGHQRNVRDGVRIGHIVIPYACKQCDEPQCMSACKKGAINRDADTGVLYLSKEKCIGCGACARKCPFKSIIMDETGSYKIIQDKEGNTKQAPITYANRCDLCRKYNKRGCFTNCPSGALKMVPFNEVLLMLPQLHREKLKALFLNGTWIRSASLPKQESLAG